MSLANKIKAHPAVAQFYWAGSDRTGRWWVDLANGWEYTGPAFDAGIYARRSAGSALYGETSIEARLLRDMWTAVQAATYNAENVTRFDRVFVSNCNGTTIINCKEVAQ